MVEIKNKNFISKTLDHFSLKKEDSMIISTSKTPKIRIKKCSKCGKLLPMTNEFFYEDKQKKSGFRSECKECRNKHYRNNREHCLKIKKEYYQKNKEYVKKCHKEEYQRNKEHYNERHKEYYQKNKEYFKKRHLLSRYKLLLKDYGNLLKSQNYCCAICSRILDKRIINIDHNHKTNKVRGILCINCNKALGLFKDSIDSLQKAIEYLKNDKE